MQQQWQWQQHKAIYIVQCSRAHNVSSDSKLFRLSAFWDQIYPPGDEVKKMKCIWITHMHTLYRFRHTPSKEMKCIWITHMHALYRFRHTPHNQEVHKMKCTCTSHMHALYRCRHTPHTQPSTQQMKSTQTSNTSSCVQMKCSISDIPPTQTPHTYTQTQKQTCKMNSTRDINC